MKIKLICSICLTDSEPLEVGGSMHSGPNPPDDWANVSVVLGGVKSPAPEGNNNPAELMAGMYDEVGGETGERAAEYLRRMGRQQAERLRRPVRLTLTVCPNCQGPGFWEGVRELALEAAGAPRIDLGPPPIEGDFEDDFEGC